MKLGAHVSIAGGLSKAIDRGAALGAECLQIFISSPRAWQPPQPDTAEIERFLCRREEQGMPPIFVHTIYLLNLCSADEALRNRSVASLALALAYAQQLGLDGVVTHLGSRAGRPDEEVEAALADSLGKAIALAPGSVPLILETSAGSTVGARIAQLGRIIALLGGEGRLGVCADTAHLFCSGYEITTEEGLEAMIDELRREVGLDRLLLVHANDSKSGLGSGFDRHANIGQGKIGEEAFVKILRHPALRDLPYVLEVPGFAGGGPDRENLEILRRLAGRLWARDARKG